MKKSPFLKAIICIGVLICSVILVFHACEAYDKYRLLNYYSNKDNFVETSGVVTHISYDEKFHALHLGFNNMELIFSDDDFEITGKNVDLIYARSFEDKIHIGDTVTFISATGYFWDGYSMPIVGLTVDREVLLEFEEGYANLMEWLKE